MANPGYADIFGAIQGQQQAALGQELTRQQIADYQSLAGYRQLQSQKLGMEMQAMRDAQKLEAFIAERRGAGAPGAAPAAPVAEMGALGGAPAPAAAPTPGGAPAAPGAAPAAPMPAGVPAAPMAAPAPMARPTFMDQATNAMNQMSTFASSQMALANEIESSGLPGAAARAADMRKDALPIVKEAFVAGNQLSQRLEADTRTAKLVSEQFDNLSSSLTPDKKGNISDAQVNNVRNRLVTMMPNADAAQRIAAMPRDDLVAYVRDQARNSKAAVDKAKDRAETFKATQSGLKSQMDIFEDQQLRKLADQAAARIKAGDPDVKPWEATVDGQRRFVQKSAETAASGGGAKSALVEQRQDTLAVNATEFVKTLGNIRGLPLASTGVMGRQSASSLFTAPLEAASNTLTTESVQRYKTEMGGLGNHLAWMVSGGLSPSVDVQKKFSDLLDVKEGDKPATVLTKLARARQEADNVLAVKEKSRLISPEMKTMMGQLRKELEDTIPFTVNEVNTWANQRKNKKETFDEFIQRSGVAKGGAAAQTVTVGDQTYSRPANFTDVQWDAYKKAMGAK